MTNVNENDKSDIFHHYSSCRYTHIRKETYTTIVHSVRDNLHTRLIHRNAYITVKDISIINL